jgi:hypothetical protein
MIDVPCPQCGVIYHADWAHLGKCIKCSRCGAAVLIIESARAVAPIQQVRDVAGSASSAQLQRQTARRVPILMVVVVCAVVLVALSTVWYHRKNEEAVHHTELRNLGRSIQQSPDTATSSAAEASSEADFADVDSFVLKEERPLVYHSLPTGTTFCDGNQTTGKGVLKIENGTTEDASLRLYDESAKRVVRCLFVKAHDSLRVTGIRQGTYDLNYTTGLDWQAEAQVFRWLPTYSQFGRQLVYSEEKIGNELRYHEIEVTLHPVIGGNVLTVPISREEFLRGIGDASLQR